MPARRVTATVSFTPELRAWIDRKVDSDPSYSSMSEVVREGLRLLMDREREQRSAAIPPGGGAVEARA